MILMIKRYLSAYNEYCEVSEDILVCNTNISKVQIGNKEQVPGSFLTIILFILVSGIVYFINM